ncbi:hypothetical protein LCI18_000562 [Fusarium solani-melongenae]|uniref:Uncharacterized protein n=1 Tax=Fusarium solani subsp. cucurbitae TaxID=2747967 RepID=A0ACD3YKW1_FUSSC|nr:hypothetical protein LCI18_000562 [Fusarium solani-melongenae]
MLSLCETGQDCHCNCKSGGDRILPTRLVLIDDEDSSIRLYETFKEQQGSYAALSHFWGPPEKHPLRTLQGNIESMKSEIPWDKISVVFGGSIWLCRQLGIKYIWIDSLCIVQDDATEWDIEAAKMAAERWQPQTSSSAPHLIVREHYNRLREDDLESSIIEAHKFLPERHHLLPTRAWAMQESILSTRIVRFTLSNITWECDGETVSEDGFKAVDHPRTFHPSRPFFDALENPTNEGERIELWMGIVAEFTCRSITFPTDRLPAMSGMASRYQSIIGGR